jgi:hypothetical protein
MKYCNDFKDDPGFPGCCGSCHEDEDDGYETLCERYDDPSNPNQMTSKVCCKVNNLLADKAHG